MDGAVFGMRLLRIVGVLCALLIAADLVLGRHGQLAFENWTGFQAAFGFAACAVLVWAARPLRRWLGRPEDGDA